MSSVPQFSVLRVSRWADSLGAAGAVLCAAHCALLPIAIALLPAFASTLSAGLWLEAGFVSFATVLALVSLTQGYRHHRAYHAWLLLAPGLLALWSGVLYSPLHESVWPHAIVMSLGGMLVGVAHIANILLSQGHTHPPKHAH